MEKTRIVFLDWDGTLCWTRFWGSLRARTSPNYAKGQKIEEMLFGDEKTVLDAWMHGKMTSEEANVLLSKATGMEENVLWDIFVRDCHAIVFDEDLRKQIAALRENAHVVLVTGNMDCFTRFVVPNLRLRETFDDIVNSSDVGYLKTENDGASFLNYADTVNIPLSQTFLLDDSLKTCEYFERLGGKAMFVKNGKEDTTRYLEEISLILENDRHVV